MDDDYRKQLMREEIKKNVKGKSTVAAKYTAKYPDSAEREYIRAVNDYMAIEKEVLLKYLPELKQILNEGTELHTDSKKDNEWKRKNARFSGIDDTFARLGELFERIKKSLLKAYGMHRLKDIDNVYGAYKLRDSIRKVANLNHKLTIAEWNKTINKTLGIDIRSDYYSGTYYQEMLEKWISENVDLIKTVPMQSLDQIKEVVYNSYFNGTSTTGIVKNLQKQYGMDKRHARLIARDQTAKLNSQITQSQQKEAGIKKYKWCTTGDGRVRKSHKDLDQKIFSWDSPPETDKGRHCHPGEDYQCRCRAVAVFDIDELDLPV
jgi:SPP1 gp7 family putative phage head morphogenesis protein